MRDDSAAAWLLEQEARALLTRLEMVKPFAMHETMVPAANVSTAAQSAIERFLGAGRRRLARLVRGFVSWIRGKEGRRAPASLAQRRFAFLRLRFNAVLTQFDIFSIVMTQRSESDIGVWLSGLDVASADALAIPGDYYRVPPVVCYLDRGHGAAIRRVRTRLPGGEENPVAVLRIPRERMVGSGIASSLVHEVGHQAAALLELLTSLRPILRGMQDAPPAQRLAWRLWERWISEIVADFWSVARLGVCSTMGLMGVVSLPSVFVFRFDADDPHPTPWIRVKLSCAIGRALYPDPQWDALARTWESYYPLGDLDEERTRIFAALESTLTVFVNLLVHHRPRSLRGSSLREALRVEERQPAILRALFGAWQTSPRTVLNTSPTLAFATLGQARCDGRLSPESESATVSRLLKAWALRSALDATAGCAASGTQQAGARASQTMVLH